MGPGSSKKSRTRVIDQGSPASRVVRKMHKFRHGARQSFGSSLFFSFFNKNMGILDIVPAGVVTGDNLRKLFAYGTCFSYQLLLA